MKPAPFRYMRPATLDEALQALAEHGDEARVLAGGQSLIPQLCLRLARPAVVIDVALLDELRGITRDGDALRIGAMTRYREAERSSAVRSACALIEHALRWVAHPQVRNRGTVGGSLAYADAAAELPGVAVALEAELIANSTRGRRTLSAAEFFRGPFESALEPDELLVAARFPVLGADARCAFLESAPRSGDSAIAGIAAVAAPDVRLAAIGVGPTPVRLRGVEGALRQGATLDEAAALAASEVSPPADVRADAEYRRTLVAVLVRRALQAVS